MFIRVFIKKGTISDAKDVFLKIIELIKEKVKEVNYKKIEQYWKIEGVVLLEAELNLISDFDNEEKNIFMDRIANSWMYFGNFNEEVISSSNIENQQFYIDDIDMINIFFDNF